ncbi:acyl carrier protein [Acinetobacter qingfengensis]|uniref:Acyl carrier protein n=1 Tax=Acinetobacter qingfengensis TaxID=1262585 RepID=A0A1E7R2U2_9GAMM|nr:acyl carrier protein [Acinetobacter qingfengensis]KAA8733851.1 acyl carrier protein [Acinetobacter qingfengensis]OEY93636.1 acyl carrier protein [Acinetobacter qingfengensis]
MVSQEQILQQLRQWMEELFEIEPEKVQLNAHLYNDLDIDSIDAVDLIVKIRALTGKPIKPEDFKSVRTVADVVDAIDKMQHAQ